LIGCLCLVNAEDTKSPVGRKFAELKKKFETEEKELKAKLAEAQDADDKKQLAFQIKELSAITASDAVDLAVDNPKDDASIDVAVFALKLLGQHRVTGGDMDKIAAFILDNHINNPKIGVVLGPMSQAGPAGERFIKTVAEKTTSKEVQGLAFFYNALALDGQAGAYEANGNADAAAKTRGEAMEMLEKAVKLSPEARVGDLSLAKAAENELVAMKISVGNPIPDVEGIDLDGKKVKMSSYRGKVVLFDFWATWCGPCRAMIPHERELSEKLSKKPFVILSVSADEEKMALTEFLGTEKMPWAHWWDGSQGPVAKMFRIKAFPTIYLVDAKGIIRKKWIGNPGEEIMDKAVQELVAEAEKK
jgi:thiol-disulfide isomerase/thioredoxin